MIWYHVRWSFNVWQNRSRSSFQHLADFHVRLHIESWLYLFHRNHAYFNLTKTSPKRFPRSDYNLSNFGINRQGYQQSPDFILLNEVTFHFDEFMNKHIVQTNVYITLIKNQVQLKWVNQKDEICRFFLIFR